VEYLGFQKRKADFPFPSLEPHVITVHIFASFPLEARPLKTSNGVWASAVRPGWVWGRAPNRNWKVFLA